MMPADLNRAQDTAIATLKLMEIAPVNWHRFPSPISKAMTDDIYLPVYTWNGGIVGDETVAETNVLVDDRAIGDYGPRNLTEKMAWPGAPNSVVPSEATSSGQAVTAIVDYTQSTDITVPRGWLEPDDPYAAPPASPAGDPTITSLAPNTGVSGAGKAPTWVTITGTRFTQWSTVETGGVLTPYYKYVSPTRIDMLQDPRSTPGTVVVKVIDHGVKSAGSNFTFS
jgi:hypothetical protein